MSVPRRRTYLRADDRKQQILEVAKGVFARRGYHRANVAHICKAAKIGRGTLYQYFDNKQAVMAELLDDIARRIAEELSSRPRVAEVLRPGSPIPARDLVVAFCQRRLHLLLSVVFTDEDMLRLVFREARGLGGTLERTIARIDQVILEALEADLRAAQNARILRPGSTRLYARFILGGIEKMILSALAADEPIDLDELTRLAVDLQLFGLLVGRPGKGTVQS